MDAIRHLRKRNRKHISTKKELLRASDKIKYKGMYKDCTVLLCDSKAELHHISYEKDSVVIPLCRLHHKLIHTVNENETMADKLKIQNLESALQAAQDALEFYGDKANWIDDSCAESVYETDSSLLVAYNHDDEEQIGLVNYGGKRAREAQAKIGEILNGNE